MKNGRLFLVADDFQSVGYARIDSEVHKEAILHPLQDGGSLWETHGRKDGSLMDAESILRHPAPVIACYPKRVAERYPELEVVFPDHDGPAFVQYVGIAADITALVVHTGLEETDLEFQELQRRVDALRE